MTLRILLIILFIRGETGGFEFSSGSCRNLDIFHILLLLLLRHSVWGRRGSYRPCSTTTSQGQGQTMRGDVNVRRALSVVGVGREGRQDVGKVIFCLLAVRFSKLRRRFYDELLGMDDAT